MLAADRTPRAFHEDPAMTKFSAVARIAFFGAVAALSAACAHQPERPLADAHPHIDLQRYMGAWYVIANVPYFAERGNVASRDVYALDKEGRVETTYVYRKSFDRPEKTVKSVATVVPGTDDSRWVVKFFGLFRTDYWILDIAPDYSWALIGQPDHKLGWVLARNPAMDEATYRSLLERFRGFGYDTAAFERVPQVPGR